MTPHHDHLLATGWTTHDGVLYRRGGAVLVGHLAAWHAGWIDTHGDATASASAATPDAALAALRQRLHDAIAGAQRALEDLG
jgi:hypothetical protein